MAPGGWRLDVYASTVSAMCAGAGQPSVGRSAVEHASDPLGGSRVVPWHRGTGPVGRPFA